jgi:penicillin-binding protein 1A
MIRHYLRMAFWAGLAASVVLGICFMGLLLYLNTQLPPVARLEDPDYSLPTIIYDRHGRKVDEVFIKRRKLVTYEQIPRPLINGLIAKEDARFFEHHGIDPLRILKAAWVDLVSLNLVEGASTLTQQTARQFFLTLEKTWVRKIKEVLLALRIEREFTKEEIITLYLNKVNFGDAWGVAAASEYYFNKRVEDLSLSESAVLIGLLPAPNRYKPTRNLQLSRRQRNIVLARMADEGFITRSEQMAASSEPIVLAERTDPKNEASAYYVELVRRILLERFGSKNLYEGGLHVYTAMDLADQVAAHQELVKGVRALDRRRGYRGPMDQVQLDELGHVPEDVLINLNPGRELDVGRIVDGVVVEVQDKTARVALAPYQEGVITWEQLKKNWLAYLPPNQENPQPLAITALADVFAVGDHIQGEIVGQNAENGRFLLDLYQEPQANGAIYMMDPKTGEVVAMVGGIRFGRSEGGSEFIRATQAERQPGSSFKPIIYAAAIEEGYTPATVLDDSPRVFTLSTGRKHTPQNYDQVFLGRLSLRESLMRSRNVPTVQLVDEMGARKVIEYARKFGITTPIPEESIIALGTHSVRLSELTRAYAVFPNGGKLVDPIYILRIEDSKGNVIYRSEQHSQQVISEATAYVITDIMRDVVRNPFGTGYKAMEGFDRPAGGKTGTTQNYTDAWYLGFIPQLVAGVYVGFDDPSTSLGPSEVGGRTAAPIWKGVLERVEGSLPIETFHQPDSVVTMRVGPAGQLLGSCDNLDGSRYELFRADTIPKRLRDGSSCVTGPLQAAQPPGAVQPTPRSGRREDVDL